MYMFEYIVKYKFVEELGIRSRIAAQGLGLHNPKTIRIRPPSSFPTGHGQTPRSGDIPKRRSPSSNSHRHCPWTRTRAPPALRFLPSISSSNVNYVAPARTDRMPLLCCLNVSALGRAHAAGLATPGSLTTARDAGSYRTSTARMSLRAGITPVSGLAKTSCLLECTIHEFSWGFLTDSLVENASGEF